MYFLVFLAFFYVDSVLFYFLLPKTLKLVRRPPWLSQTGAGAQGRRQLFVAGLPVWLGPPSNEQDRGGRVLSPPVVGPTLSQAINQLVCQLIGQSAI